MNELKKSKRVVVKIGTSSLLDKNHPDKAMIKYLADDISALRKSGLEIVLVTSGAIGFGKEKLGVSETRLDTGMQQATAAVGQNILMHEYEKSFSKHNQIIAQLLLTHQNFSNKSYLDNLNATIEKLLHLGVVPIINENDPVSIEELESKGFFSDNDSLAALCAINFKADLLIILTDVAGIFDSNPKSNQKAILINDSKMLGEFRGFGEEKSAVGRGGVLSKTEAAKKVLKNGISAVICKAEKDALKNIFEGKINGSYFRHED
mgnify:CR=1 FL=1